MQLSQFDSGRLIQHFVYGLPAERDRRRGRRRAVIIFVIFASLGAALHAWWAPRGAGRVQNVQDVIRGGVHVSLKNVSRRFPAVIPGQRNSRQNTVTKSVVRNTAPSPPNATCEATCKQATLIF